MTSHDLNSNLSHLRICVYVLCHKSSFLSAPLWLSMLKCASKLNSVSVISLLTYSSPSSSLSAVPQEAKANSVMDLELADYQRSVEQLRNQLSERDSKMEAIKREKEEYQKTLEQQKKEMGKFPITSVPCSSFCKV